MKDLKSLLFKKADNIYADVLIQSLEEFIQNGNNVTKEQFEEFLNVIPKELLNEDVDINTAYSQFITEFVKKNNTSSKHNDKQENKDSQKMDDQNKISKVFYAQIEKICLDQNLTFTQTIHQLTQLKEDYQNQYGENFALVEEQVNIVDELIRDVQNTIQTGLQKVKKEIDDDIQIQSLDTSDLEKKLFEIATKNTKVDDSDKITDALLEKGKAQIVDTIIRDFRPIEGVKRAIQDVKMDSTLREIEKINKILQMMKPYEK